MKQLLRSLLRRGGLWYPLMHVRQLPAVARWIRDGCPSPPPSVVKLHVCRAYARTFGLRLFVETGTYLGETAEWMARAGLRVLSVELDPNLHAKARMRLAAYRNVVLFEGDSAQVLPELLQNQITAPALFWLDAHYSGEGTARADVDSPVIREIDAILRHNVRGHVILIDDARLFIGRDGYPHLDDLLRTVRGCGCYRPEVSTDIIRVVPI
jgi:hypothetical protein